MLTPISVSEKKIFGFVLTEVAPNRKIVCKHFKIPLLLLRTRKRKKEREREDNG
jgi:hypothetical protein